MKYANAAPLIPRVRATAAPMTTTFFVANFLIDILMNHFSLFGSPNLFVLLVFHFLKLAIL